MTARSSPYKTTQRPPPPPAQLGGGSARRRLYADEDYFDTEDTLVLTEPSEAEAAGLEDAGASSFYFQANPDGTAYADFDTGATVSVRFSLHYLDEGTDTLTIGYSTNGSSENATKTLVVKTDTGRWLWAHKKFDVWCNHAVYASYDNADFRVYSSTAFYADAARLRNNPTRAVLDWKADEFDVTARDEVANYSADLDMLGPWAITEQYLVYDTDSDSTSAGLAPLDYPFFAGATYANRASAPFRVTPAGALVATSATITGAITATSGEISGNLLVSGTLQNSATANLGYKLNSTGLHIYNASNVQTVEINADGSGWFGVTGTRALEWTTAGAVALGGFAAGADYLRDAANTFGLASTVTGGNDIRFWAGDSFANRASAPLQMYEDGFIFAKDIVLAKGNLSGASGVTGYGYAVGDPLLLLHFDGAKPFETDYYGSLIGHKGQAGTFTWGGTQGRGAFRQGKFNKAAQLAEATTNLLTNPSFETDATTSWAVTSGTFATNAQSAEQSYFGTYSNKLVNSSGSLAQRHTTFTATAATSTVSIWVYRASGSGTITLTLQANFAPFTVIGSVSASATTGAWQRLVVSGSTTATSSYRLRVDVATGVTCYVDGAQAEGKAYVTPYCDGSLGLSSPDGTASESGTYVNGHTWSGTKHASASSRTASLLTYPSSGNFIANQGTLSLWYYEPGNTGAASALFGWRIDGNNYFAVYRSDGTTIKPYAFTNSGGTGVATGTAGAAQAAGWHHLVVTWNNGGGSGSLKMYVDGVQYGSTTAAYVTPAGTVPALEIGSFNSAAQANTFIDDFCILAHVLTLNEIKSIYYSEAPVMTGISNQEIRLSGAGLGEVFGNANGLFARDANGNASFGLLNAAVNANTWGGDSESVFDAGDFMFGSNKAGKSNLWWDASTGKLNFRGATTTQLYIDTDGTLVFGGGTQEFGANGYIITVADTFLKSRAITWTDGTDDLTQFWMEGGPSAPADNLFIEVTAPAGRSARIDITATPGAGGGAEIALEPDTSTYTFNVSGAAFNQGAADTAILTFLSSDVGHGMTSFANADVYGYFIKVDGGAGGLEVRGLRDADAGAGKALRLRGFLGEAANTTHNTSGIAIVDIAASVTDGGTGATDPAANSNLVSISSHNTIKFLFDADGDSFEDGTGWTAFDAHDDVALLNMLNRVMLTHNGVAAMETGTLNDAQETLQTLKLLSVSPDGSPFVNRSKLSELGVGALRQFGEQLNALAARIAALEK